MHPALSRNVYLVKEHVGFFKASSNYDVFDPESGQLILECREPNLGTFTKMFRFTDYKRMTPFDIHIRTPSGEQVVQITRGISIFLSSVKVFNQTGQHIGGFKQKFFSLGGAFDVLNERDEKVCTLQGKWTGWDFKFLQDGKELAHVSKKWAGIGKELFTSADNYVLEISDTVPAESPIRSLVMGAVMCIDMVLKE